MTSQYAIDSERVAAAAKAKANMVRNAFTEDHPASEQFTKLWNSLTYAEMQIVGHASPTDCKPWPKGYLPRWAQ